MPRTRTKPDPKAKPDHDDEQDDGDGDDDDGDDGGTVRIDPAQLEDAVSNVLDKLGVTGKKKSPASKPADDDDDDSDDDDDKTSTRKRPTLRDTEDDVEARVRATMQKVAGEQDLELRLQKVEKATEPKPKTKPPRLRRALWGDDDE